MAVEVILPQMGLTMEEGTIRRWFKGAGDTVEEGEPLLEITTDKVDVEVQAPGSGTLIAVLAEEGATLPIGHIIGWIGASDEQPPAVEEDAAPVQPMI